MWKLLFRLLRQAGAKRESDTDRDGAFSYHAETHAFAVGLGVVWFILVTGDVSIVGALPPVVTSILRARRKEYQNIVIDVVTEIPYFLGGVVVGTPLAMAAALLV